MWTTYHVSHPGGCSQTATWNSPTSTNTLQRCYRFQTEDCDLGTSEKKTAMKRATERWAPRIQKQNVTLSSAVQPNVSDRQKFSANLLSLSPSAQQNMMTNNATTTLCLGLPYSGNLLPGYLIGVSGTWVHEDKYLMDSPIDAIQWCISVDVTRS